MLWYVLAQEVPQASASAEMLWYVLAQEVPQASVSSEMLWYVLAQEVPQASQHFCLGRLSAICLVGLSEGEGCLVKTP